MTTCQGAGGAGTQYTYAQLQGLWINNGGPAAVAPVAGAIAMAESRGCTTALNPSDDNGRQSSFGLWQISNGTHNPPVANIYDPAVNAQQAVAKYKGAGNTFAPWGTYTSGAYKPYLSGATPDTSVPAATTASATADATCAASWPSSTLPVIPGVYSQTLGGGCIIRKSTLRHMAGGLLLGAGALIVLPGVAVLVAFSFRGSGAARAVQGTIGALGPYGRAVGRVTSAPAQRRQARATTAAAAARQQQTQQAAGNRQARRAAGSPAQQRRAVTGHAPRRPRQQQTQQAPPPAVHHP